MIQAVAGVLRDVERGPDWLLVKLANPAEGIEGWATLADLISSLSNQHFTYRLVLDCDEVGLLDSALMGQLLLLERRMRDQGGLLRLCGLSEASQQALHQCRLDGRLPHFATRTQAILGHRVYRASTPGKPR
ncbi:MAG TPA: STAS domain-containing protein [Pirellulales bacterium]|nr:STAS domain-containing protein [Pirellulales bacterium]